MADNLITSVGSKTRTVEISRDLPTVIIGERINPTGRKKVLTALAAGDFSVVRDDAIAQVGAGATVLDVCDTSYPVGQISFYFRRDLITS
jgi:5-methyltetrahydrofolate--homocysteine methyltransferase